MKQTSFANASSIFFVGIKGVAMSNIARMMAQMGTRVSGSDTTESQITDECVSALHINTIPLEASIPDHVQLVVYGAAHEGALGAQVKEALHRKIPIITQAALIAELITLFPISLAVSGCHGKTGTTSLAAFIAQELYEGAVSWLIGAPYFSGKSIQGAITKFTGGEYVSDAKIFIFEADEYGVCPPTDPTPKILLYHPTHILCTNVDFDHPDIFTDIAHVERVFAEFFTHAKHVTRLDSTSIAGNEQGVIDFFVTELGHDRQRVTSIAHRFTGVARRLEFHGVHGGVMIYDDYGHHPAEIHATIMALRKAHPNARIVLAFQAHTYSRTIALKEAFVDALCEADSVHIDAIFPSARESGAVTIRATDLSDLARTKGHLHIHGYENRESLVTSLHTDVHAGDVLVTIGAGSIYTIIPELQTFLDQSL